MINKELGLQYCGNIEELYLGLLKRFYTQYENLVTELETSEWDKRKLMIHSIKGISLNLGGSELYDISLIQDDLIKKENTLLEEYINVCNITLKSIRDIILI